MSPAIACACFVLVPSVVPSLPAQSVELQALHASDGAGGDAFGSAVALCGNRALIGAEGDDLPLRTDAGSAYVFERDASSAWAQRAKLLASDRAAGDHFGTAVALAPGRALVGADGNDDLGSLSGAAYVFDRSSGGTWSQAAKLLPLDGAAFDIFGDALALSGERALIGAPGNSARGSVAGAAYVFERDATGAWAQTAKLTAPDAAPNTFFGNVVALEGSRALVGAFSDDHLASDAGAAYVFELVPEPLGASLGGTTSGGARRAARWRMVAKLTASDFSAGAAFGSAVALSGDRALVGAFGDDQAGTDAGAAYVFERTGDGVWHQRAKLVAPNAGAGDSLGAGLALSGDRALVGTVYDDDLGTDAGSAHVFVRAPSGVWSWSEELHASTGSTQDAFGFGLALQGDLALVGAQREDGVALQSGAAFLFDLP